MHCPDACASLPTAHPLARLSPSLATRPGSTPAWTSMPATSSTSRRPAPSPWASNTGVTPHGVQRGWLDTLRPLTVPSAGRGALVGRIGNSDAATPFLVGADGTVLAPIAGRLYLGINQDQTQAPDGKYQVHIDRIAASTAIASGAAASKNNYDFKPLFAQLDQESALSRHRQAGRRQSRRPGQLRDRRLAGAGDQCVEGCGLASRPTRPTRTRWSARCWRPCRRIPT